MTRITSAGTIANGVVAVTLYDTAVFSQITSGPYSKSLRYAVLRKGSRSAKRYGGRRAFYGHVWQRLGSDRLWAAIRPGQTDNHPRIFPTRQKAGNWLVQTGEPT